MAKKSLIAKQKLSPKFGTRAYNRCRSCGRPRGYMRDFGLCRERELIQIHHKNNFQELSLMQEYTRKLNI